MGLPKEPVDLWKLVDELKKPFKARNALYDNRDRIRYRRMHSQLAGLPLNNRIADTALMVHQSEVPNQEAHVRTKRLVANQPRFEVVIYDDDSETQALGQELENGVQALYAWMNRGLVPFDWRVTQFQQGKGLGIGKIVFVPGHGDTLGSYDADRIVEDDEDDSNGGDAKARNVARKNYRKARDSGRSEEDAYDKVTEDELKKELPPFRLVSPNPTHCYWFMDDDGIETIAEVGEKQLNPLLAAFDSYGLRYDETNSRLFVTPGGADVVSSGTYDEHGSTNLAAKVTFIELRTRDEIVILMEHPKINKKAKSKDDRGVVLRFDNPFGPYTTGYVLVPGDVTTEEREEDKYQPPILASLNAAQSINVLQTAQLSAALEATLAPTYVQVKGDENLPPSDEDKSPQAKEGEVPFVPGEIKRVEQPTVELERIGDRLMAEEAPYRFREALSGDATSDTSGHRLAIQVAQADLQMTPYQNSRASAIKELLMGIIYAVRRHGLTVYIPILPSTGKRSGSKGVLRVMDKPRITPEMADLNFDLTVTLGADTPTTKYAKQAALREQEEAGLIGYVSVVEEFSDNPIDEINRVYEGKMLKETMETVVPQLASMVSKAVETRFKEFLESQAPPPPDANAIQGELPFGPPPESGLAEGGGMQPASSIDISGRVPGVGMPTVPSTGEYGPVVPEQTGGMI